VKCSFFSYQRAKLSGVIFSQRERGRDRDEENGNNEDAYTTQQKIIRCIADDPGCRRDDNQRRYDRCNKLSCVDPSDDSLRLSEIEQSAKDPPKAQQQHRGYWSAHAIQGKYILVVQGRISNMQEQVCG
jgi:hypothetical protein